MSTLRLLEHEDEGALRTFLDGYPDSSLFLVSNLDRGGLVDQGRPYQGRYAAYFEEDRITDVAAHFWNGNVVVQAPERAAAVARAAVSEKGRSVNGLLGPDDQVRRIRQDLGFATRPAQIESHEELFALDLAELQVPAPLSDGTVVCRRPRVSELDLLANWRAEYMREAVNAEDGPELRCTARADVERAHADSRHWVLQHNGRLVSYCHFNAATAKVVQVGGVWTPPAWRGRGYARAVAAGALLAARTQAVRRACLFTANPAARPAYTALGFRRIGEFGLVLFSNDEEAVAMPVDTAALSGLRRLANSPGAA